jgi:predicted RNase H-like HicB family nuclease
MSDEKLVGAVRAIERLMERVEGLPDLSEDFADARDATKRIASHLFQNKRVGTETALSVLEREKVVSDPHYLSEPHYEPSQPAECPEVTADRLRVIYERDPDFKGGSWWSASSPDLPALTTQGDGFPGVRKRVREALSTIWDDVGRAERAVLVESALRPLDYETITTIQGEELKRSLTKAWESHDVVTRKYDEALRFRNLAQADRKAATDGLFKERVRADGAEKERDAWRDQFREAEEATVKAEARFLEMELDCSRMREERDKARESITVVARKHSDAINTRNGLRETLEGVRQELSDARGVVQLLGMDGLVKRVDELVKALAKRDAEFVGACMDRDDARGTLAKRDTDCIQALNEITKLEEMAEVQKEITEHEFTKVCAARNQALTAVQLLEGKVETALAALATAKHGVLHQHERAETAESRLKHAKEARATAETAASSWRDARDQMQSNWQEEKARAVKAEAELKTISEATNLLITVAVNGMDKRGEEVAGLRGELGIIRHERAALALEHAKLGESHDVRGRVLDAAYASRDGLAANLEAMGKKLEAFEPLLQSLRHARNFVVNTGECPECGNPAPALERARATAHASSCWLGDLLRAYQAVC